MLYVLINILLVLYGNLNKKWNQIIGIVAYLVASVLKLQLITD
jgi:hypothetical protein